MTLICQACTKGGEMLDTEPMRFDSIEQAERELGCTRLTESKHFTMIGCEGKETKRYLLTPDGEE
ncbi:hypothetical protein [Vibrio anguillarum]|uniref:Uncharacterized protein n=1 Tax=Vibrio anguillarum TaxID=55601 RepID=A0A7U6FRZ6_VIBAN|nr:hypothetical protein [Vibrio anguillarum]AZS26236.1 hypothetical protein DYL72_15115 [Vibrio anguillarum]AZS26389.1 hypothetical protein DYL72_15915 [Vibrio anguillarum]MBF4374517.1 hypothetical protein [Vibrio anguillarum]